MRIGIFLVFLLAVVVLDTRFMEVLRIGGTVPGLAGTLAVFLVLAAPRRAALWACLSIGLLLDFNVEALYDGSPYHLIGPYTLGFLFGANLILPLRSMVFSRNPLTFGLLTFLFLLAVTIVYLAIWRVRGFYADTLPVWGTESAVTQFSRLLVWALYSGAIAIPVGWLLVRTTPIWGFTGGTVPR
jgi:hypothetical protein